jgi:hypothetical protein
MFYSILVRILLITTHYLAFFAPINSPFQASEEQSNILLNGPECEQHMMPKLSSLHAVQPNLILSGGNSLFPVGGGQSLLDFRQNFQISDIPPPHFTLEKTVFSPLLGQNFRKFVNFL